MTRLSQGSRSLCKTGSHLGVRSLPGVSSSTSESGHGDREEDKFEGPGQLGECRCITSLAFQTARQYT